MGLQSIERLLADDMTLSHLANDKDVGEPGGEAVARAVLHVHHIKGARVPLSVGDDTNTTQVSTTRHHAQVTYTQVDRQQTCHK